MMLLRCSDANHTFCGQFEVLYERRLPEFAGRPALVLSDRHRLQCAVLLRAGDGRLLLPPVCSFSMKAAGPVFARFQRPYERQRTLLCC